MKKRVKLRIPLRYNKIFDQQGLLRHSENIIYFQSNNLVKPNFPVKLLSTEEPILNLTPSTFSPNFPTTSDVTRRQHAMHPPHLPITHTLRPSAKQPVRFTCADTYLVTSPVFVAPAAFAAVRAASSRVAFRAEGSGTAPPSSALCAGHASRRFRVVKCASPVVVVVVVRVAVCARGRIIMAVKGAVRWTTAALAVFAAAAVRTGFGKAGRMPRRRRRRRR